jgi:hypothetical protein
MGLYRLLKNVVQRMDMEAFTRLDLFHGIRYFHDGHEFELVQLYHSKQTLTRYLGEIGYFRTESRVGKYLKTALGGVIYTRSDLSPEWRLMVWEDLKHRTELDIIKEFSKKRTTENNYYRYCDDGHRGVGSDGRYEPAESCGD